jgi:hypothetical protein
MVRVGSRGRVCLACQNAELAKIAELEALGITGRALKLMIKKFRKNRKGKL